MGYSMGLLNPLEAPSWSKTIPSHITRFFTMPTSALVTAIHPSREVIPTRRALVHPLVPRIRQTDRTYHTLQPLRLAWGTISVTAAWAHLPVRWAWLRPIPTPRLRIRRATT